MRFCRNSDFMRLARRRSIWKVLKIDRLDTSELNITEDSTTYTEIECCDLLRRINDGNKSTGGLKFVTTCYGIVGFIKFLGPYYMLLITKRRQIGVICGHAVYAISKSEMIPIPNSTVRSNVAYSKNENRYKKLLCSVDLTKDFFFSYSYNVMHSLQKNLFSHETGQPFSETMFVWNKYLTNGINNQLGNNMWTVALVFGFFIQVKLSIAGRDLNLTLIARRSRHYAGTRYLKRGVNEKGRVANDVETEQIVFEDVPDGFPLQISSVVQNRGSIPLFWSQETSRLNIKPEIILSKKDQKFEATRLHFENLMKRYGNPIIILNLIKTREKRPRESLLRVEFANAIELINKDLPEESHLKFLHLDLNKFSGDRTVNVLELLGKIARDVLNLTGIFYCQVNPVSKSPELLDFPCFEKNDGSDCNKIEEADNLEALDSNDVINIKLLQYQKGVLRTNCIDCLDRTNVAQYSYGLAALGHQLHALGYIDSPSLDLDSPLTDELMKVYEKMGDTLALQYGGSAAHNKIFCQRRGQWKAATQSQEFLRTLQRYYSNVYMDAEKQDAINVFLGHYQPQLGKPALWELDSDQHYDVGRRNSNFFADSSRSSFKRSLSDGNILCDSGSTDIINIQKNEDSARLFRDNVQNDKKSDSSPEIPTCESDSSYSRYTNSISRGQLLSDVLPEHSLVNDNIFFNKHWDTYNSNFLDVDLLSSSGNSCEEENFERSTLMNSPVAGLSSANMVTASDNDLQRSNLRGKEQSGMILPYGAARDSNVLAGFSDEFVHWVTHGNMLFL